MAYVNENDIILALAGLLEKMDPGGVGIVGEDDFMEYAQRAWAEFYEDRYFVPSDGDSIPE